MASALQILHSSHPSSAPSLNRSDHSPIILEISDGCTQTISTTPFRTRWKSKNVNYDAFRKDVEEAIPSDSSHLSLGDRIKVFNDILIEAAKIHIGKSKPSKTKFAMNPHVRDKVRKRNRLRKTAHTSRERRAEWLEAASQVKAAREEAKLDAWSTFVETLEVDDDVSKVWRVIKSLDGTPTSSAPNEALCHNGKTMTTNKSKADTFAKSYASVSSLTFSKQEREMRSGK